MQDATKERESRLLRAMTLPHLAILLGVTISFIAWVMPSVSSAGKGFVASPPTWTEFVLTVLAYLGIAVAAAAGFYLGVPLGKRVRGLRPNSRIDLRTTDVWTVWIALAGIGVLFTIAKLMGALGVGGCLSAITSFNANLLKGVLYDGYSVGILSLRYVAILAGGIAIFRYLAFREVSTRTVLSIAMLLCVALISSRLSLVWAFIVGATSYVLAPPEMEKRRIPFAEVVAWSAVFVVLVGALTISRTFGYYQERGATTFVAAAASEFQRYMAAPFQGSIESVNHPERKSRLVDVAGIDDGLSTNSALMQVAWHVGRWNVLALAAWLFWSGLACGMLQHAKGTYLIATFGILQSCHFEMWRIMMFAQGLTITLLVIGISVPLVVALIRFPAVRFPTVKLRLN